MRPARHRGGAPGTGRGRGGFYPAAAPFLEAVRYISNHLGHADLSLQAVAQKIGVHPVYLSRAFHESCGITYSSYVNAARISHAARLLLEGRGQSIAEVSYEVGFGSIRSFNRAFLACYGITPSAFLRAEGGPLQKAPLVIEAKKRGRGANHGPRTQGVKIR